MKIKDYYSLDGFNESCDYLSNNADFLNEIIKKINDIIDNLPNFVVLSHVKFKLKEAIEQVDIVKFLTEKKINEVKYETKWTA